MTFRAALDKGWHRRKLNLGVRGDVQLIEMTEVDEVYLCEICGNKVKVMENGPGVLVCCGQPMTKV